VGSHTTGCYSPFILIYSTKWNRCQKKLPLSAWLCLIVFLPVPWLFPELLWLRLFHRGLNLVWGTHRQSHWCGPQMWWIPVFSYLFRNLTFGVLYQSRLRWTILIYRNTISRHYLLWLVNCPTCLSFYTPRAMTSLSKLTSHTHGRLGLTLKESFG
jgi:hypothetical protein